MNVYDYQNFYGVDQCSYGAPPMRPPMLNDVLTTYFGSYLFNIKKITFISHILANNDCLERNPQKSLIFGIKAKFRMSHISSQMLKIAKNQIGVCM